MIATAAAQRRMRYTRPWLYPKQAAAIFNAFPRVLVEASTKSGKTAGMLLWLLERAMTSPGRGTRNFWWVAPSYGQAADAYTRCADGLRFGGLTDPAGNPRYLANKTELSVQLPNGAKLWFKTGEVPDNLYGRDVWAAVLDEASRMRPEAWHAVDSTLSATGGPARLITNVKERTNWTAELKRKIIGGALPDWGYFKLTWRDAVEGLAPLAEAGVEVLTYEKVERARRELPRHVFEMLFESEYADDGGHPFKPQYRPLSSKPAVAWGWDLAKAADWMWGIGLDEDGAVVRSHRWQHVPWPESVARMVTLTMGTPAMVDSTGLGDPVLAYAQQRQTELAAATVVGGPNFEGVVFTAPRKQQLMEGLAVAFEAGTVFGVACACEGQECPHCVLRAELEAFEYVYTRLGVRYSGPEGMHDDGVCLTGGTIIRTATGAQTIELVKPGDLVLTHRGRFRRVQRVSQREVEVLYRVKATGRPPLLLTENHPLLAWPRRSENGLLRYGEPRWVSLDGGVNLRSYGLGWPIGVGQIDVEAIDLLTCAPDSYIVDGDRLVPRLYRGTRPNPRGHIIRRFLDVDEDFCRLLGYFAAEGSTGGHQLEFASHAREAPLRAWLSAYLARLGLRANAWQSSPNGWRLNVGCSPLAGFFRQLGKRGAKRLPAWACQLPREKLWAILGGYLLGDGSFRDGKASVNSISPSLALTIAEIAQRLGVPPFMRETATAFGKPVWVLGWGAVAARMLRAQIPAQLLACKLVREASVKADQTNIKLAGNEQGDLFSNETSPAGYVVGGVEAVDELLGRAIVYNLAVDEDESYVANGSAVHNCALALANAKLAQVRARGAARVW